MSDAAGFLFLDDVATFNDPAALVVRVPAGVGSQRLLFSLYARELQLPGYFGHNFDALEECLRDLSWLDARRIAVAHESLPLRSREKRRTYLQVLKSAVAAWPPGSAHELRVAFPLAIRDSVKDLLNDA